MPYPIDEGDLSGVISWYHEDIANRVIERLEKNNIKAGYAENRSQALTKVIEAIPKGASIGIGDSVTLHQIGFISWLEEQSYKIFNPLIRNKDGEFVLSIDELFEVMRQAMIADVFLTSSNAVTLDGKLVSLDGIGNRVAAMLFGPKKVILVMGVNKIVKDLNEAMARMKLAAVMNVKRHAKKHAGDYSKLPCFATGICHECTSSTKICRKTIIIDGQDLGTMASEQSGIHVILVGENLGL